MPPIRMLPALLVIVSKCAAAQADELQTAIPLVEAIGPQQGFSVGIAGVSREGIMLGEDSRQRVLPWLSFESDRFFLRGISGGVHLLERNGFQIDAILAGRLDGWDAKDLDPVDLSAVGIDRSLLTDRKHGLDAGAALSWRGAGQRIAVEVKGDVSNASGGYEASLTYSRPVPVGGGLLMPTASVSYLSKDLANYYWGIRSSEEVAGLPAYRTGSTVIGRLGLRWMRPFADNWSFMGGIEYQRFGDDVVSSPIVDNSARDTGSLFIGISRIFGGSR